MGIHYQQHYCEQDGCTTGVLVLDYEKAVAIVTAIPFHATVHRVESNTVIMGAPWCGGWHRKAALGVAVATLGVSWYYCLFWLSTAGGILL